MGSGSTVRRFSRRDMLKALAVAGVGAASGVAAHGYMYERRRIGVTLETLTVPAWPAALDGFRIAFLTDLHRSATVPHDMVATAVQLAMRENPELIVLGGDYITNHDRRYVRPAAEALNGLSAPHGVFAVLGNHDEERDLPGALSSLGFTVLRDARTQIEIKGERVDIAGLRYWTSRVSDVTRVLKGAGPAMILLAHTPKRLIEAAALSVPLMLSGHTHGGQIVLPGVGAIAAREFPVVAGSARRENTVAFVSRGVGTVYIPVRVNCPPEIAVLTLRSPLIVS